MVCQLYRHFDAEGRLLYVGISLSAVFRLSQHKSVSHWVPEIARVTIENFPSREDAIKAERAAIRSEKPLHNKAHARIVSAYAPAKRPETPAELRAARKSLGLTQGQLAGVLGVRQATVSDWERGKHSPDGPAARLIAAYAEGYRPQDWPLSPQC